MRLLAADAQNNIAALQSGLDLSGLDDAALRVAALCCQRAPYLAGLLARDPDRWRRVAADPYLTRELWAASGKPVPYDKPLVTRLV